MQGGGMKKQRGRPKKLMNTRDKVIQVYFTDIEKKEAINLIGSKPEITRFKGLGEISPNEFVNFINENIKLEPVLYRDDIPVEDVLSYYMGKNTQVRQEFIIENLRFEEDYERE